MTSEIPHAGGRRCCDAAKRRKRPMNRAAKVGIGPARGARHLRGRLVNRNRFTVQGLRSCPARGERRSRYTSAAQRLSSDFSYLLAFIRFFPSPALQRAAHEVSGLGRAARKWNRPFDKLRAGCLRKRHLRASCLPNPPRVHLKRLPLNSVEVPSISLPLLPSPSTPP